MKHYSTCKFSSLSFFITLLLLSIHISAFSGNTCGSPDAILIGACSTTTVNGSGDAQSPAAPAACTGTMQKEEWFSVTLTAGTTYTISYITSTNDNPEIDIYSGACGSMTLQACVNNTGSGNPILEEMTFTPGATVSYKIRVMNYLAGGANMDGRFCVSVKATNDEPSTATAIVPGTSCSFTTYTNAGATSTTCGTITAPGCAGYLGGDVWFSVVVPASGMLSMEGNDNLVMQDGGMAVYTGTACGVMTLVSCNDNSGNGSMPELNLTGLTVGSTVFIRFWENGNNLNGTFGLCVYNPCSSGSPANNECSTATTLSVFSSSCSTTDGTITCATASSDANSCGNTADDDDVWYKFVATSTSVNITITSVTGSVSDMYHSLFTGTCGALGASLNCSDLDSSIPTGLTIGQTYFIRVYTASTTGGQTVDFEICVTQMSACGNPTNNDYCSNPASLTVDPASDFASTTANVYSADNPGSPTVDAVFCGQIQNNSWYKFTATATSHTFPITAVTGCTDGIQAEVYSVTHNASGCCTGFTSKSNCYNPGNTTLATVTATGLTIGQEYILMIDGYSGANCDYTISGWTATSILPVELVEFRGKNIGNGNLMNWKTMTETNNSHFIVERSYDGQSFGGINVVQGAGNSNIERNYSYFDEGADVNKNVYYRLTQVDFDGQSVQSNIIVVYPQNGSIAFFYPNPAKDNLTLEMLAPDEGRFIIRTISINGIVSDQAVNVTEGINTISVADLTHLESGIYLFQLLDMDNQIVKSDKIIIE